MASSYPTHLLKGMSNQTAMTFLNMERIFNRNRNSGKTELRFDTIARELSYVNAIHALWKNAEYAGIMLAKPELQTKEENGISTSEKVHEYFKENFPKGSNYPYYVDYFGGRLIKTDFEKFPYLETSRYDEAYGEGAAQKALDEYAKTPPSERFDSNDSYSFRDIKK